MIDKADFTKYRYFYDGGIVRLEKATQKAERLFKDGWRPTEFKRSLDDRVQDGRDDMSELQESSKIDMRLLEKELLEKTSR